MRNKMANLYSTGMATAAGAKPAAAKPAAPKPKAKAQATAAMTTTPTRRATETVLGHGTSRTPQ